MTGDAGRSRHTEDGAGVRRRPGDRAAYGDLLRFLTTLTNGDLERPVHCVAGQRLCVSRIDRDDGVRVLDTAVHREETRAWMITVS